MGSAVPKQRPRGKKHRSNSSDGDDAVAAAAAPVDSTSGADALDSSAAPKSNSPPSPLAESAMPRRRTFTVVTGRVFVAVDGASAATGTAGKAPAK